MRYLIGFIHRVVYATLIGLLTWFTCATPFGEHRRLQTLICQVFDWPVATAGRLFKTWHGLDVFYGGRSCDFCQPIDFVWSHLQLAVPVYVLLFYVPTLVRWIVRRRRSKGKDVSLAASTMLFRLMP